MKIRLFRLVCATLCWTLLTGCARYSEFTLPVLSGGPGRVSYEWDVRSEPVLTRGEPGSWDSVDALNPSVVQVNGVFWNFYSGYDGRVWHTGLATSRDGLEWSKLAKILSPDAAAWEGGYIAANGTALYDAGTFRYWYQGGNVPQIGLARSDDGLTWIRHGPPVLRPGPRGSWDERGAADPYVIRIGNFFYMYYLGQDRARRQRLGVARSQDGISWEKHLGNPVLDLGEPGMFDETGLGEPAVWSQHGWYWMLYTARDRNEERRLGLAQSRDGIRWSRVTEQPVLSGAEKWNLKVICDPHVQPEHGRVRVWFGGGDTAAPAENLNGQVGHATLELSLTP
jgi:predicted GH43/DUF377 family glycosyl hydrolase